MSEKTLPNQTILAINTEQNTQNLIEPMTFFRRIKMPPPPEGLTYGMDFFEIIPPEESPLREHVSAQLPSIISTEAFPDILPDMIEPAAQHPPVKFSSTAGPTINLPALKADGNMPKPTNITEKVTPFKTARRLMQLRSFRVVNNRLYVFEQTHYQMLDPLSAQRLILSCCRDLVEAAGSASHAKAVYDALLIEPSLVHPADENPLQVVCFKNGVLNLMTGRLHPHAPSFFVTHCLHCCYTEYTTACPNFMLFLTQVTGGDQMLIQRIWEFLGYCLTPDMGGKVVFLLQGVPDSGKSLLCSLLRSFFPQEVVSALDVHSLSGNFALSDLIGRALCISPDLPSGPLNTQATSALKKLTGSDLTSTDVKYGQRTNFNCTAKIVLASNHPLVTKEADQALVNRIVTIPFSYSVPKDQRDTMLLEKLKQERDAIAVHALHAYFNLVRNRYRFSGEYALNAVVATDVQPGQDMESCIYAFASNCFRSDLSDGIFTIDAYHVFSARYFPLPEATFSRIFRKATEELYGAIKRRTRRPGEANPTSYLEGISFIEEEMQ